MQICQSLIGGKPVTSPLPAIDKIYPATGEIVAKIEPATKEMLDEAVAVAGVAQRSWAAYELARARILHRAAALMREANAELARLEVMDVGKLYTEALCHLVMPLIFFLPPPSPRKQVTITNGMGRLAIPAECRLACALASERGITRCDRLLKSAPALAAGNAFILKPSEMTPLVAHKVADILADAGLPSGLFHFHGNHLRTSGHCKNFSNWRR